VDGAMVEQADGHAAEGILEIHHQDGNRNNNRFTNLVLLHGHSHDRAHAKWYLWQRPTTEEPDEMKVSRPVREWRWEPALNAVKGGRPPRRP
jgi:hypothetical protein